MSSAIDSRFPSVEDLRSRAKRRIPRFAFEYLDGGCNEDVNWDNLEKVYFFEQMHVDFKTSKTDDLIQLPEAKELKINVVKNRLKNSKYEGKKYIWKGGSYYGIAVFNGGRKIKLKMYCFMLETFFVLLFFVFLLQ